MEQSDKVQIISYENWLDSVQKWSSILEKIKNKECFSSAGTGFHDLEVQCPCGYCETFSCKKCPLFKSKYLYFWLRRYKINIPTCRSIHLFFYPFEGSTFFLFIKEMRKSFPDFSVAEYYCKIILKAILEDCPIKERAVQEGVDLR
ncbi:MAG: hypothetical protein KAS02_02100 [Candidatus Pacebacteria bacterium]|nr:hypothetical protein [Candidatus Paceibacterota bacterium]